MFVVVDMAHFKKDDKLPVERLNQINYNNNKKVEIQFVVPESLEQLQIKNLTRIRSKTSNMTSIILKYDKNSKIWISTQKLIIK